MMKPLPHELTKLLAAAHSGDESAQEQVWSSVYGELKSVARHLMATEKPGHTLHPTALVHEAWLRLFGDTPIAFANRRHFFCVAAKAMRHIRVDDVRRRNRAKRGGDQKAATLLEEPAIFDQDPCEVMAVHEALDRLGDKAPQKAEIVMCRYFAGLSEEETAAALGLSRRTVQNKWRAARAWLHRELSKGAAAAESEE